MLTRPIGSPKTPFRCGSPPSSFLFPNNTAAAWFKEVAVRSRIRRVRPRCGAASRADRFKGL